MRNDDYITGVDTTEVPVKHGDTTLAVSIVDDEDAEGSRVDTVPSILVSEYPGSHRVWLTWNEARALATALLEVTDIAECG